MSIDSCVITATTSNPYEGKLLCAQPYIGWTPLTDVRVDICDSSYPQKYDVNVDELYYQGLAGERSASDTISLHQRSNASNELTNDIENSIDTSTESSNLKNTKYNIRKIKPDVNSKLKRV